MVATAISPPLQVFPMDLFLFAFSVVSTAYVLPSLVRVLLWLAKMILIQLNLFEYMVQLSKYATEEGCIFLGT